jgi:hypothetical protein
VIFDHSQTPAVAFFTQQHEPTCTQHSTTHTYIHTYAYIQASSSAAARHPEEAAGWSISETSEFSSSARAASMVRVMAHHYYTDIIGRMIKI